METPEFGQATPAFDYRGLVRGIYAVRPGAAGLPENIEGRSAVRRFLEASCVGR